MDIYSQSMMKSVGFDKPIVNFKMLQDAQNLTNSEISSNIMHDQGTCLPMQRSLEECLNIGIDEGRSKSVWQLLRLIILRT